MADELQELGEKVNKLVEAVGEVDTRHRRANWRTYIPILTSVLTVVVGAISLLNQQQIDDLKQALDEKREVFLEKQTTANLNVSIIHETLAVMDGNDDKKAAFALFLSSVQSIYGTDANSSSINSLLVHLEDLLKTHTQNAGTLTTIQYATENIEAARPQSGATTPSASATQASPTASSFASSAAAPAPAAKPYTLDSGTVVVPGSSQGWDIDVFWCEGDTTEKTTAKAAFDHLVQIQTQQNLGRLRYRMLPKSVNATPEYRISGAQILRYPSKEKIAGANLLKGWVASQVANVEVRDSDKPLPWYLSLFVCAK
jgi:hypothetical protein